MILDVGCGKGKRGDIGIDCSRDSLADVVADAHKLPFKSGSFDVVYCSHVLEHTKHPYDVLIEVKRVTRKYAILRVPNASHYTLFGDDSTHLYGWTSFNFENLLKLFFPNVKIFNNVRMGSTRGKLPRTINAFKTYLVSLVLGKNEIVALCEK